MTKPTKWLYAQRRLRSYTYDTSWLLKEAVWPFTTSRDNNFQSFVSQMCSILREDIWSYWTVLMAWLKLITWRHCHWQFHLTLLDSVTGPYHLTLLGSFTWRYWTASPDVTGQFHLALLDRITWRYTTVSPDVTGPFHLSLLNLLDSFTLRYWNLSPDDTGQH